MKINTTNKLGKLQIYDNGGKSFDRYTVVFKDMPERSANTFACLCMSEHPFHPQGFGQHGSAMPGRHLGKRISFDQLPADCQQCVMRDLQDALATCRFYRNVHRLF